MTIKHSLIISFFIFSLSLVASSRYILAQATPAPAVTQTLGSSGGPIETTSTPTQQVTEPSKHESKKEEKREEKEEKPDHGNKKDKN